MVVVVVVVVTVDYSNDNINEYLTFAVY